MPNADPKGYYRALNVSPGADQTEILLAYRFLRASHREGRKVRGIGKIQEAWAVLGNAERRAEYDDDSGQQSGLLRDAQGRSRLNSVGLLTFLSALFAICFGIVAGPAITAHFVSFEPGDDIYWKKTERPIGQVLAYDEAHSFPEGATQAAYRIQSRAGDEHWLPAADLHRYGKKR